MPARVLNTRPTCPGGGQVPGTPKDRVVYGADVLLPCASLAPGLAEQPQESRETSNCGRPGRLGRPIGLLLGYYFILVLISMFFTLLDVPCALGFVCQCDHLLQVIS